MKNEENGCVNSAFQIDEEPSPSKNETKTEKEPEAKDNEGLIYGINDTPSWYLSLLFGLQQYLTMAGSTIAVPLILATSFCMEPDNPMRGRLVCTILFVSGLVTLMQATFGTRLPIIQGGSFSYLAPTFAILETNFNMKCDDYDFSTLTVEEKDEIWQMRVNEILGALIMASLLEIILSVTGLIGVLVKYISPLAVVPTIVLIGLALHDAAAKNASGSWPIAIATAILIGIFCQILNRTKVPIPSWSKADKRMHFARFEIFGLFPILLGILISWTLCAILTASGAFPEGSGARTDGRSILVQNSPWIYVPYPFQFGFPTFSISSSLGMFAAVLATMIESVGDYYACARICEAPPPPINVINRGLSVEGFGTMLAGMFGTCNGTTSYSSNIGAIRITRVGSRRVIQAGGVIMIVFGILGKFGAICATIPDPVLAGIFIIIFPMIVSIGLSNLQFIDLNSPRNLFVLGIPLFVGLMVPDYMKKNKGIEITGQEGVDQVLKVLLSTSMLIGGVLGVLLDNLIPGSDEERGIHKWNKGSEEDSENNSDNTYNLPFVMGFIKRHEIFTKIPISPTFEGFNFNRPNWTKCKGKNNQQ